MAAHYTFERGMGEHEMKWHLIAAWREKTRLRWLLAQPPFDESVPEQYRLVMSLKLGRWRRRYIKRWLARGGPWASQFRIDSEFAWRLLSQAPSRLGLDDSQGSLRWARDEAVSATWQGQAGPRRAAWGRYLDLAQARRETAVKADSGSLVEMGLILAEAAIWREAGEPVRWLYNLDIAYMDVNNRGLVGYAVAIGSVLTPHLESGEMRQAEGAYEEAIEAYLEREAQVVSSHDRGLLNLRLAECYLELLELSPDDANLREHAGASLEKALLHLEDDPLLQAKVLGVLNEMET